ncbi:hypothetical protein [Blastococcus brunescens]|uniref:Uncharacterized protein n=1 Tax=Blastococcus brunescens TaxID=1564165 RepID=A0ABZ1AZ69_9ACTN|nr:hypothetical protein [Blastococcus sp. BMG 8361]WRL63867.1 hypothetical protein U6N30_30335 [Blastococcus sp. BMG 8361]
MAQGVLESIRSGPSTAETAATALSTLTRAAALLEPVGRTALLMDTPAALAALVALHTGELDSAESVLERAIAADVGGPPARPRHQLLLAWVAMLRGRPATAAQRMAEAQAGRDRPEPRDELFLRALEVGLARRASDLPALLRAWARAREAVLRHPVDLFTLLPLGELVVAAARLGRPPDSRRTSTKRMRCSPGWATRRCGRRRCTGAAPRPRSSPATPPCCGRTPPHW